MIRISVKGLADYMTASPATQRKILRDFKYPDADEAYAKRLYYREARDYVAAFHRNRHDGEWLRVKAAELSQLADLVGGQAGHRLKQNARALLQYQRNFGTRAFEPVGDLRLHLDVGHVRISVNPDLVVEERAKPKLLKLDFSVRPPDPASIKIVAQCMFEAAQGNLPKLTSSSVLYLDVRRGVEHRGARAGARTLRELEAACETIAAVWHTL